MKFIFWGMCGGLCFFSKIPRKAYGAKRRKYCQRNSSQRPKKEKAEQADDIGLLFDRKVFRLVRTHVNQSLREKRAGLKQVFQTLIY